jgi:hypothetical protein
VLSCELAYRSWRRLSGKAVRPQTCVGQYLIIIIVYNRVCTTGHGSKCIYLSAVTARRKYTPT